MKNKQDNQTANGGQSSEAVVSPELKAAYNHVLKMEPKRDGNIEGGSLWYGWALRESFLAGIAWAREKD